MAFKRSLVLFLLFVPAGWLAGQHLSENNFERYSKAEGISHNTVNGIAQDSTGYLWIATPSGLNRYNGSRFVQFHSTSDSSSLPAEDLPGMAWLDDYRLAVYTAGVHIIDTRTGRTRNLVIPCQNRQYQYKFNMIEMVKGDKEGNIYVLTRSGFYHFDKNYQLLFRFDYYSEEEVAITHVFYGREMVELDKGRLIIMSIDGLYLYDIKKRKYKKMAAGDCPLMDEFLNYPTAYYKFFQPKPGGVFVLKGEHDSLVYINLKENRKFASKLPMNPLKNEFHFRSRLVAFCDTLLYITGHYSGFYKMRFYPESGAIKFYPGKYFANYMCNALFKDKDDQLWVGTNKGLFRQDRGKSIVQIAQIPASLQDSFPNIRIDDIFVTDDRLFAGSRPRGGLLVFEKKSLQFVDQVIFEDYKSSANNIYAMASADDFTLMLGTGGPLLLFNHATKKLKPVIPLDWDPLDWTNEMYKDSRGNIWISSRNIYRYNPAARSFTIIPPHKPLLTVPFVIREDTSGHIWMGGHGLARYNTILKKFDMMLDTFPHHKMLDKQVNALVVDQQNNLWFSSNNNGLLSYSIDSRKFRHFTRSDGLPDDNIASLMIIGDKLWIACTSAIACMDLRTSQIVSFGKEDGFPDMPIPIGSRFFYDSSMQHLYLGFLNAIVRFSPSDILRKKSPPRVFIESLVIGNRENHFIPGGQVKTPWRNNDLLITIGSINFSDSRSQGYAYRILKDSDAPWQPLGNQPSFSISNLSPGEYRIQVKSFSLNNRWPEQVKEVTLVVLPPFWKEDWFIILLTGLTVGLMHLLIKWRTSLVRKKEMEKTHIQKLIADDYKNQFELEQISNYFSSSLAGKNSEDEVLWDVASNLIGRMNYEDCIIYLWNEDKTKMVQKAAYGPKGKPEYISKKIFDVMPGQGIVGYVIQNRQPLLVNDTRMDDRYRVDDAFRLSEVCVPIIHNDELLGVIDSEHQLAGYFSERDIKILTTIATLIGNKLKQIESEQSLEAKQKELFDINGQLAEARLAALQAQMNPHFVFNALNSIKRMILDADNEKASRYLSKFALMIRMTLNHSKDLFVTLDENIEYLRAYLEMEQLRFDDSFTYSIIADENIDTSETSIPSLMIQPLVENAIWHGLMQGGADKKIMIRFRQDVNKIICTIEDNGIGIAQSEKLKEMYRPLHQSVGLENLQKRIKIMNEKYNSDCKLEITDLKETGLNGSGTRAVLHFNVINI